MSARVSIVFYVILYFFASELLQIRRTEGRVPMNFCFLRWTSATSFTDLLLTDYKRSQKACLCVCVFVYSFVYKLTCIRLTTYRNSRVSSSQWQNGACPSSDSAVPQVDGKRQ
jgi:hypothetical protein